MASLDEIRNTAIGIITAALGANDEEDPRDQAVRYAHDFSLFMEDMDEYDMYMLTSLIGDISGRIIKIMSNITGVDGDEITSWLASEVSVGVIEYDEDGNPVSEG